VTTPGSRPGLTARADRVDVWATGLDRDPGGLARLRESLADDESARAERFHFERDARRFVVARAVLRDVLGAYLGVAPRDVRFVYGPRDKPALAPPFDAAGVQFNVSHSGEIALYAVTLHRQVGVDVEQVRPLPDLAVLAERNFSPTERGALLALPAARRPPAFFACWTRKEAYVKALGDGLSHPLDAFTVSFAAGEPARLVEIVGDAAAAARWTLAAIDVGAGYEAAVAVDGPVTVAMRGFWEQPSGS
jgi:4'-phosphopantetheinyl transferase